MIIRIICQIHNYRKQGKPVLLYVPEIKETDRLQRLLKRCKIRCGIAHSKCTNMQETIRDLKDGNIEVIVTTTILERGITIENIQVIILSGEHRIYDSATLLQICGRVGRKINYPDGDITIYTEYKTKAIRKCIKELKKDNAYCV